MQLELWDLEKLSNFLKSIAVPCAIVALILAWLAWGTWAPQIASWSRGTDNPDFNIGVWGDSYGAFNALVGSLGFGAVAATLLLQMRAIKQQQDDIHRQRFETTFFELLRLLRECRQEVYYKERGLAAFAKAVGELREAAGIHALHPDSNEKDLLITYETVIHHHCEATISPYFRVIYRILHRLREDKILTRDEKLSYAKLLRGQLGSDELYLMGFNGKLALAKDFSALIEEFRLLKYLPKGPLRNDLERHYPKTAFLGHD
ncbi:putative phage abortive infection protein [Bosea sp. TWI1241]|uniref:putative phage abortive infection protein n=1 Tax=Bosea sp. TWI1241 TaxID=3148904 RepID=UPI0032079F01